MQDDSPIKNKVGAAPLPGANKVWNRVSNSWENQYNQAPYIVWGWAVGVAKKSKVKDMAFDYLCLKFIYIKRIILLLLYVAILINGHIKYFLL